ncbi:MAG: Rpn family recombination-promoting nuclease/putative transposase [Gallionella sp.]
MLKDKYLNPFTDFGFKKLFGEEPHKAVLINFLNTLLPEKHQIQDLQYTRTERLGLTEFDRRAIFDLSCVSPAGERFVVELQKAKHNFFKDRTVYYATFPIQEQAQRGEWDYNLSAVYTVGILDFVFDEDRNNDEVLHVVQLKNQHGQLFYDKLTFIYLSLPHFKKTLEELETLQDKWLYVFIHLQDLQEIPAVLNEGVFPELFETAQLACFNPIERDAYFESLKNYRDWKGVMETAEKEAEKRGEKKGHQRGLEEGAKIIARNLLDILDNATIALKTGLTEDEVQQLRQP